MSNVLFNELPRPTFRWLKVNHTEGVVATGSKPAIVTVDANPGVVTELTNNALLKADFEGAETTSLAAVTNDYTKGLAITVPAGASEKVAITIDADNASVGDKTRLAIDVAEGASLEVLYVVKGNATEGGLNLLTEVNTAENANVVFKKVQLLNEGVQQIEHRYTKLADNSHVAFLNVELGGGENFLHYTQDLVGKEAHIEHDLAYLGDNEQRFDISMLMSHVAPKSVSDIHVLGALADNSKKSFRGTLDFIRGSVAAEGAEEDTCVLLDPTVKSVSLPLLLCKEDNVVGNHAASAGQLDKTKLFYLMSRGFSEEEAKHIIVESMLRPVIDRLEDAELEEVVLAAVRAKI